VASQELPLPDHPASRLRVGLIAPPFVAVPPTDYGGTEAVMGELAVGFQAAGHEVLLFTTGDATCPVPRRWAYPQAQGQRIGMAAPELRQVMCAYEAMAEFEPDIVHDHTIIGPVCSVRYPELRVVTTVHNSLDGELGDIYETLPPRVAVVAISEAQAKAASQIPVAGIIHHGVDASRFRFGTGNGGYCLFLGRMSPDKGAAQAIEAARKAGVPLILAGKLRGPEEVAYYEEEVKPHLGEDVRYVGEAPELRKLELLANARCLLFPIRWNEPFGMVMIEAMASGTPVLAFPEGAAPEVVKNGNTGFLCEDVDAMADAIWRVGEIDRGACRDAVEGYFSTQRMVREYVGLFEQILMQASG
jgi:glycosyltransferase involved in cell wall biosynthesis